MRKVSRVFSAVTIAFAFSFSAPLLAEDESQVSMDQFTSQDLADPDQSQALVDDSIEGYLQADQKQSGWYFLGCFYSPPSCLYSVRYHGLPYWYAARQPARCGYYYWACYGGF